MKNISLSSKTVCIAILLLVTCFAGRASAADNFNVKNYGAKGDGKNMDSEGINKAIDAAAAAGGGTVYLPAGTYLSGSIHLKSNINLYIDQGATIVAADPGPGVPYDEPEVSLNDKYQDYGHSYFHNSLIWGEKLENVSITGTGTIYGKGLLRDNKSPDKRPNKAISLKLCHNVLIRDITIYHGGWFGILATGVDNLTIDNVKEDTNRDGMDIDCCQYVRISNCTVNSPFDDGICLKSSFALNMFRATENVVITNCIVSGYNEGSVIDGTYKRRPITPGFTNVPTGRIKFGTEANGGYKNISISNCVFDYCRGLALEAADGAIIENVTIDNIAMRDIMNAPIYIRVGARMRGPESTPIGQIHRVMISNIVAYVGDPRQAAIISGVPGGNIEDISLSNIRIYTKGGGTKEQAMREMPEIEKSYPEPGNHGITSAYGFYIRHVNDIDMRDIKIISQTDDQRPAFVIDSVAGIDLRNIKATRTGSVPIFSLKNVKDFSVTQSLEIKDTRIKETAKKEVN